MTDLKLEIGKHYKRRDGGKAVIHAHYPGQVYSWFGATEFDGKWFIESWTQNGRADGTASGKFGDLEEDLIAPWEDPKPRMLAWLLSYNSNAWILKFTSEEGAIIPGDAGTSVRRAPWLDEPSDEETK